MKHISEILKQAINSLFVRRTIRQERRAHKKLNNRCQHWQAVSVAGASIQLGFMNRSAAIKMTNELRDGRIIFVDDQRGVIAFGEPSDAVK